MRVQPQRPERRIPIWQLLLLGVVRAVQGAIVFPLKRMWRSRDPLDTYALCHLTSVAGDALLAVALAGSIFITIPVDQAKLKVAEFLILTMLPLALAAPLLVPLLDRAGPRRAISFAAAAGRVVVAVYAAPRFNTLLLFPSALALLVLSKVHAITKNGLTMAYAPPQEGLMRANARLGRIAVFGAVAAAPVGYLFLKLFHGPAGPIYLAALMYAISAALNVRLPHPGTKGSPKRDVGPRGRIPELTVPAIGAVGMRAAGGFLLFLLAFSLKTSHAPVYWFAVLAFGGVAGGFLGDILAPRLPTETREEVVVIACVSVAGVGALLGLRALRAPAADRVRVGGRRGGGVRPSGVPEPDAALRARRGARAGVRPLRGAVPARLGGGGVPARRPAHRVPDRHPDPGRLLRGPGRAVGTTPPTWVTSPVRDARRGRDDRRRFTWLSS